MAKLKIKKGDQVVVNTGRDKGKKGQVLKVMPTENRVLVEGINKVKKHTKPSQMSAGGIVEKELPIHVSNVSMVDPKTGSATRVGFTVQKDGTKIRVAKKSGEVIG